MKIHIIKSLLLSVIILSATLDTSYASNIRQINSRINALISIFNGSSIQKGDDYLNSLPLLLKNGKVTKNGKQTFNKDPELYLNSKIAFKNFRKVYKYFLLRFNRKGFDNLFPKLKIIVNAHGTYNGSASWLAENKFFILGDKGNGHLNMALALDVIAHEYTHAIIAYTSGLKNERQEGAIQESFADVFGVLTEAYYGEKDFYIGEDVIDNTYKDNAYDFSHVKGIRNLEYPKNNISPKETPYEHILDIYPGFFTEECSPSFFTDFCGVHSINSVLNKAAAIILKNIDITLAEEIFYRTMTQKLNKGATLKNLKDSMIGTCFEILKADRKRTSNCKIIQNAYDSVGI